MSAVQFVEISTRGVGASGIAPSELPEGGFLWCDCPYEASRQWVETVQRLTGIQFFEDHLLDAENPNHPSFFDSTHRYEIIVFRGLDMALPGQRRAQTNSAILPLRAIRVRTTPSVFFLMPGCLVTVRPPGNTVINGIRERVLASLANGQRVPSCPEELMLRILNGLVDRYLELRQPLAEQLEYWQLQLMNPRKPFRDWTQLLEARGETRRLEQLCEEQLDAIQEWRDERLEHDSQPNSAAGTHDHQSNATAGASDALSTGLRPAAALPPLNDTLQVRASDVVSHIGRVLSHARRLEQSVESAVQLHFSATAHRTNEIIRTLTTITAIFMPLTLITGIFGMNFDAIPGLHSPFGFWLTMGAMLSIVLVMLVLFRRKQYLLRSKSNSEAG